MIKYGLWYKDRDGSFWEWADSGSSSFCEALKYKDKNNRFETYDINVAFRYMSFLNDLCKKTMDQHNISLDMSWEVKEKE